jgi:hypothetical protein
MKKEKKTIRDKKELSFSVLLQTEWRQKKWQHYNRILNAGPVDWVFKSSAPHGCKMTYTEYTVIKRVQS